MKAIEEGRLYEMFGAGTAALVSPICRFTYKGDHYHVPIEEDKGAGKLTQKVLGQITDIMTGKTSRPDWQYFV